MQSPMIALNPALISTNLTHESAVRGDYGPLEVLQSAAGFYIGTRWQEKDAQGRVVWEEPGSRDSGYFASREAAERELRQIEGGDLSCVRFEP